MIFLVVVYGGEIWTIKNADCWRTDAFELWCWRTLLRVPWTSRLSNQSILKEISSEYSFKGLIDVHAETPILQPPDVKNWLIRKDLDARKDWRLEVKGMTEDEMVGWHHWLNGHEFEQAPGAGDGQGSLVCCSPWGCQESDSTERLNWTDNHITFAKILPHSLSCTSHSMNTQSPHHIWWVKGIFGNSSIFYPCFFACHIELSIHDYPFQISVALLQPD